MDEPAPVARPVAVWRGFVRGALGTGVGLAARTAGTLVVGKLVALYAPVGGLTALAQVQSVMALLTTLPTDGTHVGLVKYLAPLRPGSPRYRAWLGAALLLNVLALAAGALILALWPAVGASQGQRAVLVVGVALSTAQALLGTALLAAGRLRAYVGLAVAVAVLGTGAVAAGLGPGRSWPLPTVLLAYALGQGLAVVPAVVLASRAGLLRGLHAWASPSRLALRGLAQFGLMAVGNVLFGRAVEVAVRALLLARFGPARTDVWQAATKLSDNYTVLVAAVLSSVFYPRLAALAGQPAAARAYLRGVLAVLAPAAAVGLGALFWARNWLLPLLFAPRLAAAGDLLGPLLLGDWAKFLSWVFIFQLMARARTGQYVAVQAASAALYAALLAGLLPGLGLPGAVWAHAARYGALLLACGFFYRRGERGVEPSR